MIYLSLAIIYLALFFIFQSLLRGARRFFLEVCLTISAVSFIWFFYSNSVDFRNLPYFFHLSIHGLAILLALSSYVLGSVRIINQGSEVIIERFGKYWRKLRPGINFIVPLLDKVVLRDSVREQILDIEKQLIVTKDQISIEISVVIFWRILELELAYYAIENLEEAMEKIVLSTLRSEVGKMNLSEAILSRDNLNTMLLVKLDEYTEPWGAKATIVEIQDMNPLNSLSDRDVISFPFPDGIDWNAFKESLIRVIADNDDLELTIQGIEKRDDGVMIIKVKVSENANKEKILIDFGKYYGIAEKLIEAKFRAELKGKEEQIEAYRQNSASMERIVEMLSSRPVGLPSATVEVYANAITGSQGVNSNFDKSQNINIGRDLNLSESTLNLGEINGDVTNSISQIPALDSKSIQLKELLNELKQTLNNADDTVLPSDDKVDALEQVRVLAEIAQLTEQEKKAEGSRAIRYLQRIVNAIPTSLPIATTLITEMNKLIPQIAALLGIL